jgi:hypothetical protein
MVGNSNATASCLLNPANPKPEAAPVTTAQPAGRASLNFNPALFVMWWSAYTTLLRQNNGDPKVVQGLLRHNSIKVTMDIYDEAMSDEKQMAHRKVLRLVTRKQERTVMRTASGTGVPAST